MEKRENFYDKIKEDIILPNDHRLVKRLRLKLEDYKQRGVQQRNEANRQGKNIVYTAPEVLNQTFKDLDFKYKILKRLLDDGQVSFKDFEADISEKDGKILENAYGVIKSYVETSGEHIMGGTGLPELIEEEEGE